MIINAVDGFASGNPPMVGHVQGIGKFNGVEGGESDCIYASYDAVNLAEFRTKLVRLLASIGVSVSEDHGFVPHIALANIPPTDALPNMTMPDTPITFPALTLAWGNEHHISPLKGSEQQSSTKADLLAWERFALKRVKAGRPLREFESEHIPASMRGAIAGALETAQTIDDVRSVFRQAQNWSQYP
jgi:hypothetical protein